MKKAFTAVIFAVLILFACRKEWEKPSWDVDVVAPVFHSHLTLNDLLADSLIQVNGDSSVTLVFNSLLYRLSLDSLVDLPDTTFADTFKLPVFIPSVNVNPGQVIFSKNEEKNFYGGEAELKRVITQSGTCEFNVISTVDQPTVYTYTIVNALKNGQPFVARVVVPAGSIASPTVYSSQFDLSGYDFDLTGSAGSEYNTYKTTLNIRVDSSANATVLTNNDYVIIETKFVDLIPSYAMGYFGSETVAMPLSETTIDVFERILSGSIDISQIDVNLLLKNGIGADARVTIAQLTAENTINATSDNLTHNIIANDVNINRALDIGGMVTPTLYTVSLNESNSNIDQMIELLPDKFSVLMDATINPLGNVAAHSDFFYSTHTLEAELNIQLPLSLIASDLVIADTFAIDVNKGENGYVTRGKVMFFVENGFPLEAVIELWAIDAGGNPVSMILNQGTVLPAFTNVQNTVTAPRSSTLIAELNSEQMELLYNTDRVAMQVKFNTSSQTQHVTIYNHYYFDVKMTADFNFRITPQQ